MQSCHRICVRGGRDWHDVNQLRALYDAEGDVLSAQVRAQRACRDDLVIQRADFFGPLRASDGGLNEVFHFTTVVK